MSVCLWQRCGCRCALHPGRNTGGRKTRWKTHLLSLEQQLLRTVVYLSGQSEVPLLAQRFLFSSRAHIPPWTASNRTGFRSPYSPDATSMTESKSRETIKEVSVPDFPRPSLTNANESS